jgi:hypothetical protein
VVAATTRPKAERGRRAFRPMIIAPAATATHTGRLQAQARAPANRKDHSQLPGSFHSRSSFMWGTPTASIGPVTSHSGKVGHRTAASLSTTMRPLPMVVVTRASRVWLRRSSVKARAPSQAVSSSVAMALAMPMANAPPGTSHQPVCSRPSMIRPQVATTGPRVMVP